MTNSASATDSANDYRVVMAIARADRAAREQSQRRAGHAENDARRRSAAVAFARAGGDADGEAGDGAREKANARALDQAAQTRVIRREVLDLLHRRERHATPQSGFILKVSGGLVERDRADLEGFFFSQLQLRGTIAKAEVRGLKWTALSRQHQYLRRRARACQQKKRTCLHVNSPFSMERVSPGHSPPSPNACCPSTSRSSRSSFSSSLSFPKTEVRARYWS